MKEKHWNESSRNWQLRLKGATRAQHSERKEPHAKSHAPKTSEHLEQKDVSTRFWGAMQDQEAEWLKT